MRGGLEQLHLWLGSLCDRGFLDAPDGVASSHRPKRAFDYRKGSHRQFIDHHQAPTFGLESKLSLSYHSVEYEEASGCLKYGVVRTSSLQSGVFDICFVCCVCEQASQKGFDLNSIFRAFSSHFFQLWTKRREKTAYNLGQSE